MSKLRISTVSAVFSTGLMIFVWVSTLALAGDFAPLLQPQPSAPSPVFDLYDPSGDIRRNVGEARAEANLAWLRANLAPQDSAEQTVVAAVNAALKLDWGPKSRDGEDRIEIGEWAMLAAGQVASDRFPADSLLSSTGPFDPTPIERYCGCLRESAPPCGCSVTSFGSSGTCEFRVQCPGTFQGSCYYGIAVNMCAAESIIEIVSPVR